MIVRGFDISSYQRLPPIDWFRWMKSAGFDACVVQLWGANPLGRMQRSQYAEEQLSRAEAAGIRLLGGYIVIPPDNDKRTHSLIAEAVKAAGRFAERLKLVALDIEIEKPLHPNCPIDRLLDAATWSAKRFPAAKICVYTRAAVWNKIMLEDNPWPGGVPTLPLWDARWVLPAGSAPPSPPHIDWVFVPYGGWMQRSALQYAGDVNLRGVRTDLNIFHLERLGIEL